MSLQFESMTIYVLCKKSYSKVKYYHVIYMFEFIVKDLIMVITYKNMTSVNMRIMARQRTPLIQRTHNNIVLS